MTWVKQESGRDPAAGFHPAVERRASLKLGARRDGLDPPLELHAWVPAQPWCWNVPTSAPALALGESPLLHLAWLPNPACHITSSVNLFSYYLHLE